MLPIYVCYVPYLIKQREVIIVDGRRYFPSDSTLFIIIKNVGAMLIKGLTSPKSQTSDYRFIGKIYTFSILELMPMKKSSFVLDQRGLFTSD